MRPTTDWETYFQRRIIVTPSGCWDWQLKRGPDNYGMCYVMREVTVMAHRVSYIKLVGPIPDGLTIDHLCRNRSCINPEHLEPVTMAENTRRAAESISTVNAAKTHCVNGHEFDDANTCRAGNRRRCRACNRDAVARYQARRAGIRAVA